MNTDEMKSALQLYIDELWNKGNLEVADELFDAGYVAHQPANPAREQDATGPEAIKTYVRIFRAAFPDLTVTLHAMVAEGDEVATRGVCSGTHTGDLFGLPPTGKFAVWTLTGFDRFNTDGKITDGWGDMDMLGALQTLGVVPGPAGPPR